MMIRKLFASALMIVGLMGVVELAAADPDGCCPDSGCKVCKPVVETKTISKKVFDCAHEDFCLPFCSLFSSGCCNSECGPNGCGRVYTRKVLIVKVRKHDECINKCVVDHVPAVPCCPAPCAPGCGTSAAVVMPGAPMPMPRAQVLTPPVHQPVPTFGPLPRN